MLNVPVYNASGQPVGQEQVDEAWLGGEVNPKLLKQAIVMYLANRRQGTAQTKSRAAVEGSKSKLYRQKGTGRARAGNVRTPVRRGGGHTFAKEPRDFRQDMPTKMRRLARNHAILSKLQNEQVAIVDGLKLDSPKTAPFYKLLSAVGADRGCVVATNGVDQNIYRSGRNIPKTEISDVAALNAYQVLARRKLVFTREAFDRLKEMVGAAAPAAAE